MEIQLPEAFTTRMKRQLGSDYPAFEQALLHERKQRGLRVNQTKISVDDYLKITPYDLEPVPYTKDGFYFPYDVLMGGDPGRHAGMFYLQDPSAMLPVNAVDIQPGWKVLDLCASPGGKTSQISDAVGESGLVIANDIREGRIRRLIGSIQRLGLKNVMVTMSSASDLCAGFHHFFDMALVDAPCSCEGMFRKKSKDIPYWSEERVTECAAIQAQLLEVTASVVRPGGFLVYATCTFSTDENEHELCDTSADIRRMTLPGFCLSGRYPMERTRRFYPHVSRGEGQFVAVMRRAGTDSAVIRIPRDSSEKIERKKLDPVLRFLERSGISIPEERIAFHDRDVWILPQNTICSSRSAQLNGVLLGELADGTLRPAHGFFSTFGASLLNRLELNLDDPLLSAYLQGMDIQRALPEGFGAVTVAGCPIGGFFSEGGTLYNLYPEILRNWKRLGASGTGGRLD